MSTIINPWAKAWANAERSSRSGELGRVKFNRRNKCAKKFLDGTHRYERSFSDKGTGELAEMNGRKAKELNDKLYDDYLIAMHNDVDGRSLERWKVVGKFIKTEQ